MSEVKEDGLTLFEGLNANQKRVAAAIVGALVADAAALGVHWMYAEDAVRKTAGPHPEFKRVDKKDYLPPAYFAHGRKQIGEFTHYGEVSYFTARLLAEDKQGEFNPRAFQDGFVEYFGFGGNYIGYVDHPMRSTLVNLYKRTNFDKSLFPPRPDNLPEEAYVAVLVKMGGTLQQAKGDKQLWISRTDAAIKATHDSQAMYDYAHKCIDLYDELAKSPAGADDQQMPGLVQALPVIARFANSADLDRHINTVVRELANSDLTVEYVQAVARVLTAVIAGKGVDAGLKAAIAHAETGKAKEVVENLTNGVKEAAVTDDSVAVSAKFGKACFLRMGVPNIVHTLSKATSYVDGVRRAMIGGGDNVARACIVGAILAAEHGLGTEKGIPVQWLLQTKAAQEVLKTAIKVASHTQ